MLNRRTTSLKRWTNAGLASAALVSCVGILSWVSAASASPKAHAATPAVSFFLDSFNANNHSGGTVVRSPVEFLKGQSYTVVVEGTFSAWGYWPQQCGVSESKAMFASPQADGQPSTPVGADAATQFARPRYKGTCSAELPRPSHSFQINVGHGWQFFQTVSGSAPTQLGPHQYAVTLVGKGARPAFRIGDWHTSDNNGEFKITVR